MNEKEKTNLLNELISNMIDIGALIETEDVEKYNHLSFGENLTQSQFKLLKLKIERFLTEE